MLWDELVEMVYLYLVGQALEHSTVSYAELCRELRQLTGIPLEPREALVGRLLAAVSVRSYDDSGTLVTVLVRHAHDDWPGPGFFDAARRTLLLRLEDDEAQFFEEHREAVYDAYRPEAESRRWAEFGPRAGQVRELQDRAENLVDLSRYLHASAFQMQLSVSHLAAWPSQRQIMPPVPFIGRCHCQERLRLIGHAQSDGPDELRIECVGDPTHHYWVVAP